MTGCRAIDNDEVVVARHFELLELAEHHDVVDAGRGRGDDIDDSARCKPFRHTLEAVRIEVVGKGLGSSDREHLDRRIGEEVGDHGFAVKVNREDAKSCAGRRSRQYSRYRCLSDAALPSHYDKAGSAKELQ